MICSLCSKVALYQVRGAGFCRDHKAEGVKAEARRLNEAKAHRIRTDVVQGLNMATGGRSVRRGDRIVTGSAVFTN